VFIVDRQGRLRYANQSAATCFRVSPHELAGKGQDDLFPPELVSKHHYAIEQVFCTGTPYEEDEELSSGSDRVWLNIRLLPIRDDCGQITAVMGVCRDVSDRKRVEQIQRESHHELERQVNIQTADLRRFNEQLQYHIAVRRQAESQQAIFQRLVEEAGQIFLMAGMDQRITYVNAFGCQLLGRTPSEIVGASLLDFYTGEDRERLEHEALPGVLADGRWTGELFLTTDAGKRVAAWQHVFLVRDTEADTQRFATVIADITSLRATQEILQRERENLWQMLRSSDQERQMIAYEIHDGLTQQLAGALLQFQSYEYQKDLHPARALETFAAGLAALRQAHFEARRLISGVRPPILDEYGIDAALAVLANEKSLTAAARITYQSEVAFDRLPPLLENTIYRIAQEALANACKHSGSQEVRMTLIQEGGIVRLEVCDLGIGFDPETVVEHRFGLQGIRVRTRMLGGQLTIDSVQGRGTSVRVVLPFAMSASAALV
jgi:PAS domain S-box-containing protein